jgi:hypothetical protein
MRRNKVFFKNIRFYPLTILNVILTIMPWFCIADAILQLRGQVNFDPLSMVLAFCFILIYRPMKQIIRAQHELIQYPIWLFKWFFIVFPPAVFVSALCVAAEFLLHLNGIG